MFPFGFRPRVLRALANESHIKRVFDFYLKHHRDELLGLGYHQYISEGRGILVLSCSYRELFFGKGFFPERNYLRLPQFMKENRVKLSSTLNNYDPETEILVCLKLQNSSLRKITRLSKKGLSLSIVHRQYLNRLLDYVATPGVVPS